MVQYGKPFPEPMLIYHHLKMQKFTSWKCNQNSIFLYKETHSRCLQTGGHFVLCSVSRVHKPMTPCCVVVPARNKACNEAAEESGQKQSHYGSLVTVVTMERSNWVQKWNMLYIHDNGWRLAFLWRCERLSDFADPAWECVHVWCVMRFCSRRGPWTPPSNSQLGAQPLAGLTQVDVNVQEYSMSDWLHVSSLYIISSPWVLM